MQVADKLVGIGTFVSTLVVLEPDLSALDDLIKIAPRETSGSSSSNRFSFQVDWAFARLIELHKAQTPYVIVLDLHDDVVIGDHGTAPTTLDFYQVKTKTTAGAWSEAVLLRRPTIRKPRKGDKKRSLSILGKLYLHKINFPNVAGKLCFVSNARCGLKFDSRVRNDPEIFFAKLITSSRKKIAAQLRDEHDLSTDPDCDQCLRFVVTDLDVDKHDRDVLGDLAQLCGAWWPDGNFPVTTLYRAIGEQLRAASNLEAIPPTVPELLEKKAINSIEVQEILEKLAPVPALTSLWLIAYQALISEQVGPFIIRKLHGGWNRYGVQRRDPSNRSVKKLQQRIQEAIKAVEATDKAKSHLELVNAVAVQVSDVGSGYDEHFLKGAILLEFVENEPIRKLPPADSQSSGEAA